MKELEAQIAGLDFDIGQEKQRNYTYLSPESVEKYLNSIICGDIQEMPVRKLIVKAFVREVILDNDNIAITYNFTENYTKYRVAQEMIQKVQRQSRKKTAYNKNLCSNKLPPLPPEKPAGSSGFFHSQYGEILILTPMLRIIGYSAMRAGAECERVA